MADKFMTLSGGKKKLEEATSVSTGVGEAGDIVALDAGGKIDVSMLPTGIAPDVKVVLASETLAAGDYVNIYDNLGTENVRLADSTNSREAHGFVKDAVTSGSNATVYFEGDNDDHAGLTIGARYYLGVAGAVTTVAPETVPANQIHQFLGVAVDATTINTDIADCILVN